MAKDWAEDFIRVKELKKMIEHLNDDDFVTITIGGEKYNINHKMRYLEDTSCIGFWELRCE